MLGLRRERKKPRGQRWPFPVRAMVVGLLKADRVHAAPGGTGSHRPRNRSFPLAHGREWPDQPSPLLDMAPP